MNSPFLRVAGALLALAFLGRASAGIDTVNGGTGDVPAAIGSVLTIDGSGFGVAKPKVFTTLDGKLYALKVTSFTDTQITAEVKKGVLGLHQLLVRPKGATEDFTYDSIEMRAPAIDALLDEAGVNPVTEAGPGTPFTITGDFFGAKKFKIFIGGKKAKVLSWTMNEILLEMPKKLSNGLWDIELLSKIAADADEQITMVGSTVKVGKVKLEVTFGTGPTAKTINYKFTQNPSSDGYIAFGGTTLSYPLMTFALFVAYDVDTDPVPATIDSDDHLLMTAQLVQTEKGPNKFTPGPISQWFIVPGSAGLVVNITASGGGQVGGTFTGDLPLAFGPGTGFGASLHIEGSFVYED